MMDPKTVIESYVRDVTQRLPGRDRADVAMELGALLAEDLAARSAREGRPANEAMTVEMLRSFGSPAQAAMRYRPTPPLLDPADTRPFLLSGVIGALALAAIVPLGAPHAPKDAVTTAILAWLGLLVLFFATRNWARRQWPSLSAWRPRDPNKASRAANLALIAVMALGIVCYGAPHTVFALFTSARLPASLEFAPQFHAERLPWLLAIWGLTLLLYAWVTVRGSWRPTTRRIEAGLAVASTLAVVWYLADGPIFQAGDVDRAAKAWLAVIAVAMLADAVVKITRLARAPAPRPPNMSTLAA
jgi:hypothetical protein